MMASRSGPDGPAARAFYQRPTAEVARDLLGKVLLRRTAEGEVAVRLSEVEAYLGPEDAACHTRGGLRSPRNQAMWGEAGHAYVYLVYGIHHCLNVVTVGGAGEAILLRGGLVLRGLDLARRRRGRSTELADGPGKLCQVMAVTTAEDGADLCTPGAGLSIRDDGFEPPEREIQRTPRVGVGYAGEAALWPLRFVWSPTG